MSYLKGYLWDYTESVLLPSKRSLSLSIKGWKMTAEKCVKEDWREALKWSKKDPQATSIDHWQLFWLNTILEQFWGKTQKRTKYLQKYTHRHAYIHTHIVHIAIISLMFYRPKSTLGNIFSQINPLWLKQMDMSTSDSYAETEQTQGLLNCSTFYWICLLPILTYFEIYIK